MVEAWATLAANSISGAGSFFSRLFRFLSPGAWAPASAWVRTPGSEPGRGSKSPSWILTPLAASIQRCDQSQGSLVSWAFWGKWWWKFWQRISLLWNCIFINSNFFILNSHFHNLSISHGITHIMRKTLFINCSFDLKAKRSLKWPKCVSISIDSFYHLETWTLAPRTRHI